MKAGNTDQTMQFFEVFDQLMSDIKSLGVKDKPLLEEIREKINYLAFYDDAGYQNLRSLYSYVYQMRKQGRFKELAFIRYNLRHFSLVNREIGMDNAAVVLRRHYKKIKDILGDEGRVSCLGGDVFMAVCQKNLLEKVLGVLTETVVSYDEAQEKNVAISANAGVFALPDDYIFTSREAIRSCVISAYMAAMNGGQGHIVFYNDELARKREKVTRIQQGFMKALRTKEFFAVYQPKVNIWTGKICGAEALCRWSHNGELVFPNDFIPALEETSDVCLLDFYMLGQVCKSIRRWMDKGLRVVRISVNLSRKHLLRRNLLKELVSIIDANHVPHEYIEFEFTETATEAESNVLSRIVKGLQNEGFCASVDDYGMGYSSLNLIKTIPWNVMKIDRSILPTREDYYDKQGIILKHVVAMIKELGLECVVEGVETEEQLKLLKETRCDLVQGYYFWHPMPLEEFEKLLEKDQ